jgi:hypothetical protein
VTISIHDLRLLLRNLRAGRVYPSTYAVVGRMERKLQRLGRR